MPISSTGAPRSSTHRNIQQSLANPTSQFAAVGPDWISRAFKLRTDRELEQCMQALRSDGIYLRHVHEQLHQRNGSLSQMNKDLDKAFLGFAMQLRDLQIESPSDFPKLDVAETFPEFRNRSSAVVTRLPGCRWIYSVS
jgi:hypothetical protein